jgi:hypothetical protein
VQSLTYSEGPKLIEGGSNETNQNLKQKDIDDLAVGLELKLRKLGARFALVLHNTGIMT